MKKIMIGMVALGAAIAATFGGAAAQDRYPSRSIKFVVPFVAGSATDTLARLLGNRVSQSLGQTVIVENIGGGSGIPAAQNVVRSAPDGYTVFITSNTTHASNQSMLKRVPYDAVADFEPITKLGTITLALVGHPSVPANTVQELIAYAKANPGKLTFGSGSTSSRACRRVDEDDRRHRHAACALPQQSAGRNRPARRPDQPFLRRYFDVAAASAGRSS